MLEKFITLMLTGRKDEEKGATAVEYGLMVALIAVAIIVTVGLLGDELIALFNDGHRRAPAIARPAEAGAASHAAPASCTSRNRSGWWTASRSSATSAAPPPSSTVLVALIAARSSLGVTASSGETVLAVVMIRRCVSLSTACSSSGFPVASMLRPVAHRHDRPRPCARRMVVTAVARTPAEPEGDRTRSPSVFLHRVVSAATASRSRRARQSVTSSSSGSPASSSADATGVPEPAAS